MTTSDRKTMRVAFQGEPGRFQWKLPPIQLLGNAHQDCAPAPTFEAAFTAIGEGSADALLAPGGEFLGGLRSGVLFDLLMESRLVIVAETILAIEMQLIATPGASPFRYTFRGLPSNGPWRSASVFFGRSSAMESGGPRPKTPLAAVREGPV